MAAKNKKLSYVASKARRDKEFFRALLKDYRATLKANNIPLSKADMSKLGKLTRAAGKTGTTFKLSTDAKTIRRVLLKGHVSNGENWPSPEWSYEWKRLTFNGGRPAEMIFTKFK